MPVIDPAPGQNPRWSRFDPRHEDDDNKNKSGLFSPALTDQAHLDLHASAGAVGQMVPPGVITAYGGTKAGIPSGWLLCDGDAYSREEYADLFAAIGTTFGVGDGTDTFNVPDMRARFPVGAGTGPGNLANTGGEWDHDHSTGTIAVSSDSGGHEHNVSGSSGNAGGHTHASDGSHTHSSGSLGTSASGGTAGRDFGASDVSAVTHTHDVTGTTGSGGSHNHGSESGHTHGGGSYLAGSSGSAHQHAAGNITGATGTQNPPYLTLYFIIKV